MVLNFERNANYTDPALSLGPHFYDCCHFSGSRARPLSFAAIQQLRLCLPVRNWISHRCSSTGLFMTLVLRRADCSAVNAGAGYRTAVFEATSQPCGSRIWALRGPREARVAGMTTDCFFWSNWRKTIGNGLSCGFEHPPAAPAMGLVSGSFVSSRKNQNEITPRESRFCAPPSR